MVDVLKLGGSLLTDKTTPESVDEARLTRVADALAGVESQEVVLIHGGGSFGHPAAERHGMSPSAGTADSAAVMDVTRAMRRLNDRVVDALQGVGLRAVGVQPFSCCRRTATGQLAICTEPIQAQRRGGFLPVLHGDVIVDVEAGATILSGDELAIVLAASINADRIGFCAGVPGVLDASNEVIPRIESMETVSDVLSGAMGTDVTGGMAQKVQSLLNSSIPSAIFGPDDLTSFLGGELPGTRIGE